MAAASDVTFDVLLGGKVTPQLLKSFKDLEELMKKQGATAKTINAVMGRAYKDIFDTVAKDTKKDFGEVEKSSKHAFTEIVAHAREAQHKVAESFDKMRESYAKFTELLKRPIEWIGITGLISGAGAALGGAELIKKGIEVHKARETESATLRATLAGRGAGAQTGEWEEAAERIAAQARVGHDEAMKIMTRLAASGKFNPEQAQRMAMSLIGLGGGTAEGAEAARAAYGKASLMMMAGRVRPTAIGAIAGGSGMGGALMQQLSRDTGIPVTDLAKQFAQAKVSKKGEVTGGALAGAKGIDALNKAILELGQSRGFEMIKAKMSGMEGMFYRFGEHWEDFTNKIGEAFEEFISPIADRVNELLDSINFDEVFKVIIDDAQQFGHLIKAVWDTIANSPVITRVKAMWEDFWKSFTGGVELYGPFVETWNDKLHHELGTHMARHMTEAGREWVKNTSEKVEQILQSIVKAFQWFIDHGKDVWWWIVKITEAFVALKAVEIAATIISVTKALWDFSKAVVAVGVAAAGLGKKEAVTATIAKGSSLLPALGGPLAAAGTGLAFTWGVSKGADIIGDAIMKSLLPHLGEGQTTKGEEYNRMQAGLEEMRAHGASTQKIQRAQEALDNFYKGMTDQEKASIKVSTSMDNAAKSADTFNGVLKKATGNDLVHFDAAVSRTTQSFTALGATGIKTFNDALTQATQSLATMSSSMMSLGAGGFGGGIGSFGGATSGAHFTDYGPSVPGDQPGGPTYDWNSYHHVGAFPSITGPLRAGDVALGYGAQSKYHVMPGQMFTDEYGRTWRFADRSGSKDPLNVDVFKGAMGGIFRSPTRALIGESGPEAVLPLRGAAAAPVTSMFEGALANILHRKAPATETPGALPTRTETVVGGLGGVTINVNVAGNAHDPEGIANAVERVIRTHWRRQAVV